MIENRQPYGATPGLFNGQPQLLSAGSSNQDESVADGTGADSAIPNRWNSNLPWTGTEFMQICEKERLPTAMRLLQ
jgi:hypothetical protein